MAFIFANDPGQLANQKLATDRTNVDIAENDRQVRQKVIDTYNQNVIQAQRQAEEDQRQQQAQQFQFANLASQNQQVADAARTQQFQFGQTEADKAAQRQQEAFQFGETQKLKEKELGAGEAQNDFASLMKGIETGDITSPEDIEATYTHLTPQQKAMAAAHLTNSLNQQSQQYQQSLGAAAAATKQVYSKAGVPSWFPQGAAELSEEQAMSLLSSDKAMAKYLPMLKWDEGSQQFVPILRKPANAPSATPASPSVPLPTGGAAPLSPAVTAAAQPGFNFVTPPVDTTNQTNGNLDMLWTKSKLRAGGENKAARRLYQDAVARMAPSASTNTFQFGNQGQAIQTNAPVTAMNQGRIQPMRVSSQQQFDALPSGATYIGDDGRMYRKP